MRKLPRNSCLVTGDRLFLRISPNPESRASAPDNTRGEESVNERSVEQMHEIFALPMWQSDGLV